MGTERWRLNLAASGAVLVVVAAVAFGLPALDAAVPVQQTLEADRLTVADGVSVMPPAGAVIAKRRRSGAEGSVMLLIGPVRYAITVSPFDGDPPAALARLRKKIQSMRGYQVTSPEFPVRTDSGLPGAACTFSAPGRGGRLVAFTVPAGRAVEITITGSGGDFHHEFVRIDESIASLTAEPGP